MSLNGESAAEAIPTPFSVQNKLEEKVAAALKLTSKLLVSRVVNVAIELGVFEIIAKAGPTAALSASEIISRLAESVVITNPNAAATLERFLRFLACYSILNCTSSQSSSGEWLYSLTTFTKFLVNRNDYGHSLAPFHLLNHHKDFIESWYNLSDAIVEGGVPFNMANGMSLSEYQNKDLKFGEHFKNGMTEFSVITMKKILRSYEGFKGLTSLVNVGANDTSNLALILSMYPSIKAINFDFPHVIQEPRNIYSGIEHVAGNMFERVPKGDAIFIKWICHDWSDEHCLKLLKNCYNALPKNGKVIVAEWIVPMAPNDSVAGNGAVRIDVMMLAYNPNAKVQTEKEFQALAKGASFRDFRVVCSAFSTYVMEFLK